MMAEMEAAIQRLWARLPQVGAFSFTASNGEGSATDWNGRGEGRVQVIAMVAFSESDREAFQTVFEQLVEVFSERDSVQRIVRRGTDFGSFLDELVAVIDG